MNPKADSLPERMPLINMLVGIYSYKIKNHKNPWYFKDLKVTCWKTLVYAKPSRIHCPAVALANFQLKPQMSFMSPPCPQCVGSCISILSTDNPACDTADELLLLKSIGIKTLEGPTGSVQPLQAESSLNVSNEFSHLMRRIKEKWG